MGSAAAPPATPLQRHRTNQEQTRQCCIKTQEGKKRGTARCRTPPPGRLTGTLLACLLHDRTRSGDGGERACGAAPPTASGRENVGACGRPSLPVKAGGGLTLPSLNPQHPTEPVRKPGECGEGLTLPSPVVARGWSPASRRDRSLLSRNNLKRFGREAERRAARNQKGVLSCEHLKKK